MTEVILNLRKVAMIACLAVIGMFASCGDKKGNDPDNNDTTTNSIVNAEDEAWVNNDIGMAYVFLENGNYKSYTFDGAWISNGDGTYKVSGNSLTIDNTAYPFSVTDNSLTLTINGNDYTYTRTKPFTPGIVTGQLDERLILPDGQAWVMDDISVSGYIFKQDGTYSYHWGDFTSTTEGTWSTSGNTLSLVYYAFPDGYKYTYSVSDNTLTLTNYFGDTEVYIKMPIPN